MITIKDLTVEFGGNTVFEGANFIINQGDKIGLIGRNGCGKSTFFKTLLGKVEPASGEVDIPYYYRVGHLDQHIKFSKPTVMEEVASVLDLERAHEEWKGEKILFGLGFKKEDLEKKPEEFSGGWQVKINLAKILLEEPDLLLLDEPTNYLDIYSIRWLGEFLRKWPNELVIITHDRAFMDNVINHTLLIHRKKFRKMAGKTGRIKDQIAKEEEIYEATRVREEKEREKTEDWIRRFGAKASLASRAQSMQKRLDKQDEKPKLEHIPTLDFKFTYLPFPSGGDVITVKNLTFGWTPEKLLIKDLSFSIGKKDKVCVIGKNGNGKSTLLNLLAGELQPLSGDVELHPKVEFGLFGQMNTERLNPAHTIAEEIHEVNPELDIGKVRRICGQMLFNGDLAYKKISVLSGGEKSRVMLGKILLTPVNLLFLDEPTNHFDMESSEALMDAIKEFEGAVVMVSHNEYFLKEIANKLIIFDDGKITCYSGGYDDFLKNIGWKELI